MLNNGTFSGIFHKLETYSLANSYHSPFEFSKKFQKTLKLHTNQGLVCQTGVGPVGRAPARHWNE